MTNRTFTLTKPASLLVICIRNRNLHLIIVGMEMGLLIHIDLLGIGYSGDIGCGVSVNSIPLVGKIVPMRHIVTLFHIPKGISKLCIPL